MQLITIQDLDNWKACDRADGEKYSDTRLKELLRGKEGWTPLEVSRMQSVPTEARIWVLLRPEVLGDQFQSVVDQIVDRTIRRHALKCGISEIEVWAEQWFNGKKQSAKILEEAWAARIVGTAAEAAYWAAKTANIARTAEAAVGAAYWAARAAARTADEVAGAAYWAAARALIKATLVVETQAADAEAAVRATKWAGAAEAAWIVERKWQLNVIRKALK